MMNANKKLFRYLLAIILIIGIVIAASSVIINYDITPSEAYGIDTINLIEDSSFEEFNQTVYDCCNALVGNASIYASKSIDAYLGNYSLNLTSFNHCACINKQILNFSNSSRYLFSLYYKGDNPRFCNSVSGDNKCLPLIRFEKTENWTYFQDIYKFTNKSERVLIHLYANSDGTKIVTNLYDDLQVHKLVAIENPSSYAYNPNEEYIFRTKADNRVKGELISDIDAKTGEAYFLTAGKPYVTIKFPWSEIVIIIIMIVVIIRLLFKKQVLETEEAIKKVGQAVEKAIEKIIPEEKPTPKAVEETPDMTDPHRRKLWYSEMYRKKYAEKYGKG